MIRTEQVITLLVDAIAASPDVAAFCERYKKPLQIFKGHRADQPLFDSYVCPACSVSPSDNAYDLGVNGSAREVKIRVRWAVWNELAEVNGNVTTFCGVVEADQLGHLILDAVRAISGLGDDMTAAEGQFDSSAVWPLCQASAELTFALPHGLANEPAI